MPVGAIEAGAFADLITLEAANPIFAGAEGPAAALDALVTAGDGRCIDQAWVGGQRLAPQEEGDFGSAVRRIMQGDTSG
jgi:cytosine/adenosine deaminase-related metal-dependent hydrolase